MRSAEYSTNENSVYIYKTDFIGFRIRFWFNKFFIKLKIKFFNIYYLMT